MNADLRRKLLLSLVLALLVYIALALLSDWAALKAALIAFPWLLLVPVLGLTLINYGGRALRWHWYMRVLGVPIQLRDSLRVFGVGMLMVMTPGKAGEFLKAYMTKNITGTPMMVTAPAPLAERLLDGAAMLCLAAVGLFVFPNPTARWIASIVMVVFLSFIVVVQNRPLAEWFLALGERLPGVRRFVQHLHRFYESAYILFSPRNVLISIVIGIGCWAAEGAAYYLVLTGFGVEPSISALFISIFIFSISTVVGAAVAMPGGLGGMEGSLVALAVQLLGMTTTAATAAALLIRFCTLWLGVLVGLISFVLWHSLLEGAEPRPPASAVAQPET